MVGTMGGEAHGCVERSRAVLVVEDDWLVALSLAECLELEGIEVVVAHGGDEAIREAHARRFEAIFLDYRLPDMSGLDIYEAIATRDDPPRDDPQPVVLLTGHNLDYLFGDASANAELRWLAAPADLEEVEAALHELEPGGTLLLSTLDAHFAARLLDRFPSLAQVFRREAPLAPMSDGRGFAILEGDVPLLEQLAARRALLEAAPRVPCVILLRQDPSKRPQHAASLPGCLTKPVDPQAVVQIVREARRARRPTPHEGA